MVRELTRLAMSSPTRHAGFRRAVLGHVALVSALLFVAGQSPALTGITAQILLCAALVEGAALIGWRLTQLPKTPALEFLLVTSTSPRSIFFAELSVSALRFALVQISTLPVLGLAIVFGIVQWPDLAVLLGMPMLWGLVAGVSICAWVYEPKSVRRIGEMLALLGLFVYLVVGVLAAENLLAWMQALPEPFGEYVYNVVIWLNTMNPFGVIRFWFSPGFIEWLAWNRFLKLNFAAAALALLLAWRAGSRLVGHFQDRHYHPIDSSRTSQPVGDRPLSWWAVRRVMEYSGRVNLYLAGGFCLAYAAYIVAGDSWPAWVGRGAFMLFDSWGGPAMVATAMAVMAAVPAAYQYGLWDSSVQDRSRRLELLLLTDLSANDYAHAAFRAAWNRGRGYFLCAAVLGSASALGGRITWLDAFAAALGCALLWSFAFAIGFRGFTTGHQTNGIATAVTLGCPLLLGAFWVMQQPLLAALMPTAVVFMPMKSGITIEWLAGFSLTATITVRFLQQGLAHCDRDLRKWFDNAVRLS